MRFCGKKIIVFVLCLSMLTGLFGSTALASEMDHTEDVLNETVQEEGSSEEILETDQVSEPEETKDSEIVSELPAVVPVEELREETDMTGLPDGSATERELVSGKTYTGHTTVNLSKDQNLHGVKLYSGTLTIILSGHTLTLDSTTERMFTVIGSGTLFIYGDGCICGGSGVNQNDGAMLSIEDPFSSCTIASGVKISGFHTDKNGGALCLKNGSLKIRSASYESCEISDCSAKGYGGAVYATSDNEVDINMEVGKITGCSAACGGGAIYAEGGNTAISLTGVEISGNSVPVDAFYGGGVMLGKDINSGNVTLGGNVKITGNKHGEADSNLHILNSSAENMKIADPAKDMMVGVSLAGNITDKKDDGMGSISAASESYANYAGYFKADDPSKKILYNESGKNLEITHDHELELKQIITPAGCLSDGKGLYRCTLPNCVYECENSIPATGHAFDVEGKCQNCSTLYNHDLYTPNNIIGTVTFPGASEVFLWVALNSYHEYVEKYIELDFSAGPDGKLESLSFSDAGTAPRSSALITIPGDTVCFWDLRSWDIADWWTGSDLVDGEVIFNFYPNFGENCIETGSTCTKKGQVTISYMGKQVNTKSTHSLGHIFEKNGICSRCKAKLSMSEYKVDNGVDQKIVKFPGAKNVYLHFSWIYYGIQIYDGKGKLIKKPSSVNSLENGGIVVPGDTARILVPSEYGSFTIDDIMPMYDDNFEIIEPTCTTGGYHRYTYCGKSTNLYIVPALGHSYDRELKCIRPGCGKEIPSDFGRVGGDYRENFTFQDAKSVEVYFSDISTYDYVRIYDGKGTEVGKANLYWSNLDNNSVTVKGNTVTIVHYGIYDAGSFKIAGFVPNYSDSAVSGLKRQLQDINKRPEEYTHEHMMSMLDAYEMVAQNKEYREQMQADPEFMQLIENLASKVKAQNHRIDHDNYSVMLFGAGSNGAKTPDWRYILSSKNISVPDEIKAKLGAKWKILASEDITVSRYGGGAAEGRFQLGFSGKDISAYRNKEVVVFHMKADGTIEELKAVWDKKNQCFTVITDSCSPFVLAAQIGTDKSGDSDSRADKKTDPGSGTSTKSRSAQTGDDNSPVFWMILLILMIGTAGYSIIKLRRRTK